MKFRKDCTESIDLYKSRECSRNVMKILGIDTDAVEECYYESFTDESLD